MGPGPIAQIKAHLQGLYAKQFGSPSGWGAAS